MAVDDIGVLIATHHRIDDARIGMEIIRSVWDRSQELGAVTIVHAYNGASDWYPHTHLEDRLVRVPRELTHFRGAASLLDAGMNAFATSFPQVRYVVAMAADVWAYKVQWIKAVVKDLHEGHMRLAASRWKIDRKAHGLLRATGRGLLPTDGLASDFFIVERSWATDLGLFPLRYAEFLDRSGDLLNYVQEMPFLERYLAGRFLGAVRAELEMAGSAKDPWGSAGPRRARELLRLLEERRIDPSARRSPSHKGHWPAIGLCASEDSGTKKALVLAHTELEGPTVELLRRCDSLDWFNRSPREAT